MFTNLLIGVKISLPFFIQIKKDDFIPHPIVKVTFDFCWQIAMVLANGLAIDGTILFLVKFYPIYLLRTNIQVCSLSRILLDLIYIHFQMYFVAKNIDKLNPNSSSAELS